MALPKKGASGRKKRDQRFSMWLSNIKNSFTNISGHIGPLPDKAPEHLIAAHVGRSGHIRLIRKERGRTG